MVLSHQAITVLAVIETLVLVSLEYLQQQGLRNYSTTIYNLVPLTRGPHQTAWLCLAGCVAACTFLSTVWAWA